jgi:deoxycytidylate deaminase
MFAVAREVAKTSNHDAARHGAVIAIGNEVISASSNIQNKSHPIQKHYNAYRLRYNIDNFRHALHAEISALIRAKKIVRPEMLSKMRVYVYRVMNDGRMGMSRPCCACLAMIKDLGIKHIYYTTEDGLVYENLR